MWKLGLTYLIVDLLVILIRTRLLLRLDMLDAQARLARRPAQGDECPKDAETASQGSLQHASRLEHHIVNIALVKTSLAIFVLTLASALLLHVHLHWYYWALFIAGSWLASFYFMCLISFSLTFLVLRSRLSKRAVLGIRF
jgi:hypothetical protein